MHGETIAWVTPLELCEERPEHVIGRYSVVLQNYIFFQKEIPRPPSLFFHANCLIYSETREKDKIRWDGRHHARHTVPALTCTHTHTQITIKIWIPLCIISCFLLCGIIYLHCLCMCMFVCVCFCVCVPCGDHLLVLLWVTPVGRWRECSLWWSWPQIYEATATPSVCWQRRQEIQIHE